MTKPVAAIRTVQDIPPSLDRRLTEAYLRTTYRVWQPPIEIRIGQLCPAMDVLLAERGSESWAFVTAWNPGSRVLPADENAQRQAELEQIVESAHWSYIYGVGIGEDTTWPPEESLLVLGISAAEAVALGRRFGQNALVFGRQNEVPELWWL